MPLKFGDHTHRLFSPSPPIPPPLLNPHLPDCNFPAWTVFLSLDWPEWTLAGSAGLDVY